MSGFELGTSGIGSDRSVNCATSSANFKVISRSSYVKMCTRIGLLLELVHLEHVRTVRVVFDDDGGLPSRGHRGRVWPQLSFQSLLERSVDFSFPFRVVLHAATFYILIFISKCDQWPIL